MRVRLNLDRLQAAIGSSGLSQNHWALKIGISRGHWSDLLNGKHPYPSPKTRERLVEVLGIPFDQLFTIEAGPTAWHDNDFRAAIQDRYLIDRELGQGAMGSVYLARDLARARLIALKALAPEAVCGIGIASFGREISVVSRLQHPHILPLFDSGAVAEHPFYVMPWVREGSLRDRLKRETRLALPLVVTLTRGVSAALHHAHADQVLHCDVKPENILLHGEHAYVADFGISRIVHAEVSEWRARRGIDISAGTPAYVSPEQANGDEDLDGRTDVYSLGCVVYELLTGRQPFEGSTTEAVVMKRFVTAPRPLRDYAPEVPAAMASAVMRAMAIDRDRRPATALEFTEELTAAATNTRRIGVRVSLATSRAVAAVRRRTGRAPANTVGGTIVQVAQDLRLTLRGIRRSWRFAAAFVLPLALGLGAGATFFAIIDRVLYQPPPEVERAKDLVRIAIANEQFRDPFKAGNTSIAYYDYEALTKNSTTLEHIAGYQTYRPSLGRGEGARVIPATLATASYFTTLGVRPQVGRFYTAEEDAATSSFVPCVAGDRFWRNELGGTRDAIGKVLVVGKLQCDIVGVTPKGFNGTGVTANDLWIPLRAGAEASQGDAGLWNTDRSHWMRILARPRTGVSMDAIDQDATRAYRTIAGRTRDPKLQSTMVADKMIGGASSSSDRLTLARWLVGGAIVLLLLVSANLVNLLVARNIGHIRETAVRLALGGSRARLFRQHLLECAILSLLAGLGALLVVQWGGPIARSALFPGTVWADGTVTVRIATLATLMSLTIGTMIAAVTTYYAGRVDPAALLNSGGSSRSTASRAHHRARLALVSAQAALSVVLLLASAGFIRSFRNAADAPLGFDVHRLVFAEVPNMQTLVPTNAENEQFYSELHDRLKDEPGIEGVSLGYMNPWFYNRTEHVHIPGRDSLPQVAGFGDPVFDAVTPDYLETMRLHLRAGRWLSPNDASGGAPVVVVSEALAKLYWSGTPQAIGQCIQVGDQPACRQVVGVVQDIRFSGGLDTPLIPSYYLPVAQAAAYGAPLHLFIRARTDPAAVVRTVRHVVQSARAGLPAADVHLIQQQMDPLLASWKLGAMAFTALGVVAATIALLGLFSVIAYLVADRTREFAIRIALGAQSRQVLLPVLNQGTLAAGAGATAGVLMTVGASHWIQPLLFHVRLLDGRVVALTVGALLLISAMAAIGPARRASLQDPVEALRAD